MAALGRGETVPPVTAHAAQLAGNVLPHDWKLGEDGYTEEEMEDGQGDPEDHGRRLDPGVADHGARAGAHRPFRGDQPGVRQADHASEQAREALRKAPGIILLDDYAKGEVPLPLDCEGRDEVFVGRVRRTRRSPTA